MLCQTCFDNAVASGYGDLGSSEWLAEKIASERGDTFTEHECERADCDCNCLHDQEREWKREDEEA